MASRRQAGLDELMIVNPGSPGSSRTVILRRTRTADRPTRSAADVQQDRGIGCSCGATSGRFFLGEDGALYELIE
jgi:hypothetical protein